MAYKRKTVIKKLQELNDNWPRDLWLFSGNGMLHLMEYDKNGKPLITKFGGVDDKAIIKTFVDILNDGGDW